MKDRSKSGLNISRVEFAGNTSGWEAYDYKVILRQDAVEKTYGDSKLVLVDDLLDTEEWTVTTAVVVSVGHLAFTEGRNKDGELIYWDNRPGVGDRVLIKEYVGQRFVGDDEAKYLIVNDKEIACGRQA